MTGRRHARESRGGYRTTLSDFDLMVAIRNDETEEIDKKATPVAPWISSRPDGSELFVSARITSSSRFSATLPKASKGAAARQSASLKCRKAEGQPLALKPATTCDVLHARTGRLA